ncbi:MAG: glycosyltransferase [Alkalinema sp. RU_4_3]|nr:glycosyltransferase [Alkalinema sp. RU_4_3]
MSHPKVSLITTVYNRENYLPQAIESILTQTHQTLELILWDDGSTDDSLEICQHYADQDDRIRVIPAPHQGRGPSVAQASALATGQYIGIVDSDDLLAQDALTETVQYLEDHPAIGMVYTDYIIIDENDGVKSYGQHCQIPYDKDRLLTEFIIFHFRLMHTHIYQQIGGFDPEFMYCQDYDLCLRLSETTDIAQLHKPLYQYRHHRNSISCEKQIDQIFYGKRAIENAIVRRGMADTHELEFQVFAHCTLLKNNRITHNTTSPISHPR